VPGLMNSPNDAERWGPAPGSGRQSLLLGASNHPSSLHWLLPQQEDISHQQELQTRPLEQQQDLSHQQELQTWPLPQQQVRSHHQELLPWLL